MRQYSVFLSIAATLLISLPLVVESQHCVEAQWNQALSEQTDIERWYNQRATHFNHLFTVYQQQVLLHKEFSSDEIISFWRPGATEFHTKMDQQIAAALMYAELIDKEKATLKQGEPKVRRIQEKWQNFISHCEEADLNINALSSHRYVDANNELIKEMALLHAKLSLMHRLYMTEADTLSEAKKNSQGSIKLDPYLDH
ncbi:DUF3570 domain-containing protein [Vibrio sp. ZSDE26]|uniref:DUF3570 domain-containing protein n=1 Tax=Vibrio amylolyticus TaxID=2847292 RepID=A0A9X2BN95_9VIBR|nr:DUF3570 domain-containing protein [Vibrio amylolyticus]MCK6265703.1 DUF3570 domain-containing protein [Vibrio amylolyticus]